MNSKFRIVFVVILSVSSCNVAKRNEIIFNDVHVQQLNNSDYLDLVTIDDTSMSVINGQVIKLHNQRMELFKKHNINIGNGYIYIIDQFGNSYSQFVTYGNVWSKQFNYYYLGRNDLKFVKGKEFNDDDWDLFKRAIEEWDLEQIKKHYSYIHYYGFGTYIASRIKVKNNKVVDIQTYIWNNNDN